jgi:flagellar basal-body rod protein FlgC
MAAQRLRAEVIGHNIANASTTMTEAGEPFRRQITLFSEVQGLKNIDVRRRTTLSVPSGEGGRQFGEILNMTLAERRELIRNRGVQVTAVLKDYETPFTPVYDPSHPHANEEGYFFMPNVDVAEEQMDLLAANVSFLNSLAVFDTMTSMATRALSMGRS